MVAQGSNVRGHRQEVNPFSEQTKERIQRERERGGEKEGERKGERGREHKEKRSKGDR